MHMFSPAICPKWGTRWRYHANFLEIGPVNAIAHCELERHYRRGNVGNPNNPQPSTLSKLLLRSLPSLSSHFVTS